MMITLDKFDECLISLKRKFGWRTKNIIYKRLWSTPRENKMPTNYKSAIAKEMRNIYKNFSFGDFILNDYFSATVNDEIARQDETFHDELTEFRNINYTPVVMHF